MNMDATEDEWELSKENVQPLRQGRKLSSLNAGLQPQSSDQSRIRDEKHVFEAELRTYAGDDPLEVWYRYIRWAEQTFPKGGKDSNLTTILERCVHLFKDEEKYRNDERYIYPWMKMADVCNDPLEIYNFMYDQNIGCELSCFYEAWASLLERLGNTKRADAIYLEGLKKQAQPFEILRRKHEEFQKRVARQLTGGQDEPNQEGTSADQKRQVLSKLHTTGKKRQVPISRTGTAIQGHAGVLPGAFPKPVEQVGTKGIQIFCDENQDPTSLPPQTGAWASAPRRDVTNKENEKKAGVWTKQKMSKPSVNVPISAVNTFKQPSFTVHVDDNDQAMRTPAKMPEIGNQILSARKASKVSTTTSYLKNMTVPNAEDKNEKPMYCKDKIYCGAEEYSFEELRAIRWLKKQEQMQREEEERLAMEECRKKLELERQLLLDKAETMRQQRLKLEQEEQAMLEEARRKRHEHHQRMERESQIDLQRQQQVLEQNIQQRLQEQQQAMPHSFKNKQKSQTSVRQLMFEDGSHGNTENIPPQMLAQMQSSCSRQQVHQPQSVNQSLNNSNRTPNNLSVNSNHIPHSGESFDRTLSGPPSPTVNTKEALRLVMGMFNTSLELDKAEQVEDVHMNEASFHNPAPSSVAGGSGGSGLPFVIYDENDSKQKKSAAPVVVYEDKENSPPSAMRPVPKRSPMGNVLQPSRDIVADPTGEQDCIVMEEPVVPSSARSLFEDDNFDGMVSHARDDITIAPVGSHHSFAAAARCASTPSTRFEMMETNEDGPQAETGQTDPPVTSQDSQDQTASNTSSNSFRKNLSPIMEGSSEDSGANSKSSNHLMMDSRPTPVHTLTPVLDRSEDTMSLLQAVDDGNQSTHVIDMSAYVAPELDEKTENLMSMSICIVDPKDPFDSETKDRMISSLKKPLIHYDNYIDIEEYMPDMRKGNMVSLGKEVYNIIAKIGEGGFAKIYLAEDDELDFGTCVIGGDVKSEIAIKVEKPAQKWEFYICNELQDRLAHLLDPVVMSSAMMQINSGYFFKNGSCLVTEYQPYGTLLDLVNKCKSVHSEAMSQHLEPVMAYMTIELLHMVENMHRCKIIHGDIKPDNFLVVQFPHLPVSEDPVTVFGGNSRFVQLIDFGQSIDMTKYPAGTTFLAKVNTQCFQCIEMKANRPWTYQTDLFGLAGTIHVLIFSQYMNVYQTGGEWRMNSRFVRNWNSDLWKKLFRILLNVPSCDEIPDLSVIRHEFEQYFVTELLQKYNQQCADFNRTILSNKKMAR